MNDPARRRGLAAPYALPAGFAALLVIGAVAAALHGRLPAGAVLALAAVVVGAGALVAEPAVAPLLAGIGWLTAVGFAGPPYGQLRPGGAPAVHAAVVITASALAGAGIGLVVRRVASSSRLLIVDASGTDLPDAAALPGLPPSGQGGTPDSGTPGEGLPQAIPEQPGLPAAAQHQVPVPSAGQPPVRAGGRWPTSPVAGRPDRGLLNLSGGIGTRRRLAGVLLAAGLPLLTAALAAGRAHLNLADDLLLYLVAVVAIAVVGGFWPAVLGAITASLLLNWYFTEPLHALTVAEPRNLLALMLFVTVAVTVSSVVHLAARRAVQAARSGEDAASLLALAQTVLGGADTPAAVLYHLAHTWEGRAELVEQVGDEWVRVAVRGTAREPAAVTRVDVRPGLALLIAGQTRPISARVLDGFAAQAAAALDRDRLRTQAAQAEALAEGNRMRTALLAAVSHDLRTPLASIEQSADRLDALIGNLLDMSRLAAGSLRPFLRPTAIDEVAPVALRGLDAGTTVQLVVPDGLPLVRTDPGLLERVLANLFANALAYSPPGRPPALYAEQDGGTVVLAVVDHGPGVPDDQKPRMFEPFERLSARNTGTGVGLGLAVVKGFTDTMGGSVAAADTSGGGLTIRVTLPVASQPARRAAAAEQ